jgi:uncharacterized membrane protein YedE/YeeE
VAFGAGVVFSIALGLGGMTLPERIIGFLDFTGDWDPTLAAFMLGAVGVFFLANRVRQRRAAPLLGTSFPAPPSGGVDRRLMAGSALFGLGWGLAGFCPAPALTSVVTGAPHVLVFSAAMLGGMVLHSLLEGLLPARSTRRPSARLEGRDRAERPDQSSRPTSPQTAS